MKRHGLLALALLPLWAPGAFAQASALANCKYYTKTQQDFEQALPHCEQAIRENPEDPEARFYGAWCLAETGHLAEAWESFAWLIARKGGGDKKIRKHAKMAEERVTAYYAQHFNRGVELLQAEDTAGAREEFRKATQIDPRKTGAYLNLGFAQTQLDDLDGALASFETAVQMAPGDSTARLFYWDALDRKLGELRGAATPDSARIASLSSRLRETLEKILELNPSLAEAHLRLADLDLAAGRRDAGLEHMRRAIDLAPENVVNLANLGIRFYQDDEYGPAIDALNIVLEYETDTDSEVWVKSTYLLGLSHLYRGDRLGEAAKEAEAREEFLAALEQFEKLLEKEPDSLDYLVKAGLAARKAGEKERGDRYLIRWEELKEKQVVGE